MKTFQHTYEALSVTYIMPVGTRRSDLNRLGAALDHAEWLRTWSPVESFRAKSARSCLHEGKVLSRGVVFIGDDTRDAMLKPDRLLLITASELATCPAPARFALCHDTNLLVAALDVRHEDCVDLIRIQPCNEVDDGEWCLQVQHFVSHETGKWGMYRAFFVDAEGRASSAYGDDNFQGEENLMIPGSWLWTMHIIAAATEICEGRAKTYLGVQGRNACMSSR